MNRLTANQRAMLRALAQRSLLLHEVTQGQSITVNSLVNRGLAAIERKACLRWIEITDAGRATLAKVPRAQ